MARLVGNTEPHLANPNERACYYAYFEDGDADPAWRPVAAQWRDGAELGTAFPCDDGLVLVLLMPPVARRDAFDADREGEYDRTVAEHPSYFRRSSGPGWALPGDAGHFKDPITAQGIRDALRFGRLLGEMAAPVLDDPVTLDRVLREWEQRRDAECLETYHWTGAADAEHQPA